MNDRCVKLKLMAITGDSPALKMALNFIGHNGYYPCYFCYIRGIHRNRKRQYPYESSFEKRTGTTFAHHASDACRMNRTILGHNGESIFHRILDVKLPESIVVDYAHATLLRHAKSVFSNLYLRLSPANRREIDMTLERQAFPHFFHRKMKPISQFAFVKATEVRNILLYGFVPLFYKWLSADIFSHFCLFICGVRLLHGLPVLGERTSHTANQLINRYYQDFNKFYDDLENFVLHLHTHFADQYRQYGSFCHLGSFGQESLIGYMSKNFQGSRHQGDLICENYCLNLYSHHAIDETNQSPIIDGPFDPDTSFNFSGHNFFSTNRLSTINGSMVAYRRCRVRNKLFHSLFYMKRNKSVSFIVRYRSADDVEDFRIGKIIVFVTIDNIAFALIESFSTHRDCSSLFRSSPYHRLLSEPFNQFFYLLSKDSDSICHLTRDSNIIDHCILFDLGDHFIATPVSSYDEHD
jgi:hypothetical protein